MLPPETAHGVHTSLESKFRDVGGYEQQLQATGGFQAMPILSSHS